MDNNLELWIVYEQTKDKIVKDQLILQYAPLVKYVAGRVSVHIGRKLEYDDLVGFGVFGLLDAIEKFDYRKGVKFETYASLRIRGSIIDSIRKLDWVPRSLRQKNKVLEQAYTELENKLGRVPTEEEIADRLDITVEQVDVLIQKSSIVSLVSLDDYLDQNHEDVFYESHNSEVVPPEKYIEKQEVHNMLVSAIDKLSEKEQTVITLYYFEDMTLKEISKVLNVSESRVSQIHSKAVFKLQRKLEKHRHILFA